MSEYTVKPIGTYFSRAKHPYEAGRQGVVENEVQGLIQLAAGVGFEQALEDLKGFERVWLLYVFHENPNWKPKVRPPRGPALKRGVFSTRSPYRPNPIGLSCVRLIDIAGLDLAVAESDLLDGTPILDIKPYLPYADSFPNARTGWLENIEARAFQVLFSARVEKQLQWLKTNGVEPLRSFLKNQLEYEPTDEDRKRVRSVDEGFEISYRTWRADFQIQNETVNILRIRSGYSARELCSDEDTYLDKHIHRKFLEHEILFED